MAVAERLRLSNAARDRLVLLAEGEDYLKVDAAVFDHGIDDDGRALRRLLYRLGPENLRDIVLLDFARRRAGDKAPAAATLERALAESPGLNSDQGKRVVYNLGLLHEKQGDVAAAREQYLSIYEVDVSYRDVSKKVTELK